MITVVDYGAGNLRSIRRALELAGADVTISADPADIAAADAVVLPGVGAAGHAMQKLATLGLSDAITDAASSGKPLMGICLGMQLLFGHQDEGGVQGLGLLPGRIKALAGPVKVPHMGWNLSRLKRSSPLGSEGDVRYFYFVHSFIAEPEDEADVLAVADYGQTFPSIVTRGNVWGTQFHPEKSGTDGLQIINTFVAHASKLQGQPQ
ncbi:MAG: imidazole glycerol phosphate synthase subunit HisH [Thermomicrobiales bacterium]|jgi:glutamine amidotransferase